LAQAMEASNPVSCLASPGEMMFVILVSGDWPSVAAMSQ